jgi:signal peptidase I
MDVKPQSFSRKNPFVEPKQESGEPSTHGGFGGFTRFLLQVLAAVLIFRIAVFSPFTIPSESMVPQLVNGDYLLAAKWPYGLSRHSLPFRVPLADGRLFASPP